MAACVAAGTPGCSWERSSYVRRALVGLAGALLTVGVLFPVAVAIVLTHRPRVEVKDADVGRPYDDVRLQTSDGLALAG